MKFRGFFLATVSTMLISGVAMADCCDECCGLFDGNISWDIGTGYRQDNLKWDFPGFSPGESIHERWNNINIAFIETNGKASFCDNYLLKFDFDYGWSGWEKE